MNAITFEILCSCHVVAMLRFLEKVSVGSSLSQTERKPLIDPTCCVCA